MKSKQRVGENLVNSEFSRKSREEYWEHASGLLMELGFAGFEVRTMSELREFENYDLAVPILHTWLPQIELKRLHSDVVECLKKRMSLPTLINEYKRNDIDRWVVGNAIATISRPSDFERIRPLLKEEYGDGRDMLVLRMGRMKGSEKVVETLIGLLDGGAALYAIEALGRLKTVKARSRIERFTQDEFLGAFWESHAEIKGLRKQVVSELKKKAQKALERIHSS